MSHFDMLKIYSCGKHCEKWRNLLVTSNISFMALIFHFKCTLKCHLQFVSTWTSLKFSHLVMGNKLRDKGFGSIFFLFLFFNVFYAHNLSYICFVVCKYLCFFFSNLKFCFVKAGFIKMLNNLGHILCSQIFVFTVCKNNQLQFCIRDRGS